MKSRLINCDILLHIIVEISTANSVAAKRIVVKDGQFQNNQSFNFYFHTKYSFRLRPKHRLLKCRFDSKSFPR